VLWDALHRLHGIKASGRVVLDAVSAPALSPAPRFQNMQ